MAFDFDKFWADAPKGVEVQGTRPPTTLICMSRGGHRAVQWWLNLRHKRVDLIESKPFEMSIRRARPDASPTLLIRDYPNWAASIAAYFSEHHSFDPMVDCWITHAAAAHTVPTILFPEWVRAGHGNEIDIPNSDGFGAGTVLTRNKLMRGDPTYERLMDRTDATELNARVFGRV